MMSETPRISSCPTRRRLNSSKCKKYIANIRLKKELPNFIRSSLEKIYNEKRKESVSDSYISNIYGGGKDKKMNDVERRQHIR